MPKNYPITAMRNLWRQPGYASINILGLSEGLASSFLILLWVQGQLRFDRFHEQGDQLYVAKRHAYFTDGQIYPWSAVQKQVSLALEAQFPDVLDAEMVSSRIFT
jgi:hypothetical protein